MAKRSNNNKANNKANDKADKATTTETRVSEFLATMAAFLVAFVLPNGYDKYSAPRATAWSRNRLSSVGTNNALQAMAAFVANGTVVLSGKLATLANAGALFVRGNAAKGDKGKFHNGCSLGYAGILSYAGAESGTMRVTPGTPSADRKLAIGPAIGPQEFGQAITRVLRTEGDTPVATIDDGTEDGIPVPLWTMRGGNGIDTATGMGTGKRIALLDVASCEATERAFARAYFAALDAGDDEAANRVKAACAIIQANRLAFEAAVADPYTVADIS